MKRRTNPFIVVLIALVLGATLFFIATPGDDTPPNDNGETEIPEPLDLSGTTGKFINYIGMDNSVSYIDYPLGHPSTYTVMLNGNNDYIHKWTIEDLNTSLPRNIPQQIPFLYVYFDENITSVSDVQFDSFLVHGTVRDYAEDVEYTIESETGMSFDETTNLFVFELYIIPNDNYGYVGLEITFIQETGA